MEFANSQQQEIEPRKNEACYFMPGGLNTLQGSGAAKELLTAQYGESNVTIINSILTTESPSPPAETRFETLSNQIIEDLKTKDKVVVIAHSLGVTEFNLVWQQVLKKVDKEFLENNTHKLNLLLISPAEVFAKNQQLTLYKRIASLFMRQSNAPLSWVPNETVGLESLIVRPIQGYQDRQKELQAVLRAAMPDLSHAGSMEEGDEIVSAKFDREYDLQLKQKDVDLLDDIDADLQSALGRFNADNVDFKEVKRLRSLLKSRGKILRPYIAKAYAGEYFEERQQVASVVKALKPAMIGALWRTINQMRQGAALATISSLRAGKAKVGIYVPEYDTIVKPEDIRSGMRRHYKTLPQSLALKLAEDDTVQVMSIMIGAGHAHASYVLQPRGLLEALTQMGK